MTGLRQAFSTMPFLQQPGVRGLLAYSFVLTLARASTLPFMVVYLAGTLQMDLTRVGFMLSLVLAIGTITSLFGGLLVDRFPPVIMLFGTAGIAGAMLFALPFVSGPVAVLGGLSVLYAIVAVSSIVVKTTISLTVPAAQRVPVFSLNYTLVNVAFAVGPLIIVYVIGSDISLAFGVAGGFACAAALIALTVRPGQETQSAEAEPPPNLRDTIKALRGDVALTLFTIGGLLSAVVYDQFSAYLSQYLLTQLSPEAALTLVAQIVTANAIVVITTQFLLGRYVTRHRLLMFVCLGTGCLIVGLVGFSASTLAWVWIVSMVIFTMGEIVLVPAEYLYVDLIAPDNMRGVYFALHNLGALGGAASPALCAALLALGGPVAMFAVLICCAVGGCLFYAVGHRLAHRQGSLSTEEALVE